MDNATVVESAAGDRRNVGSSERAVSAVFGALLAAWGLRHGRRAGLFAALAGGELVRRGLTGRCYGYDVLGVDTRRGPVRPVMIEASVTVWRPAGEVYAFWRDLSNLPRFMRHVESVVEHGAERSHWVARSLGTRLEWDALLVNDQPGRLIAWRSLDGAPVDHAGSVRFAPADGGAGTEVAVTLAYRAPLGVPGAAGRAVALLLRNVTAGDVKEDLRSFKRLLEASPGGSAGRAAGGAADGAAGNG